MESTPEHGVGIAVLNIEDDCSLRAISLIPVGMNDSYLRSPTSMHPACGLEKSLQRWSRQGHSGRLTRTTRPGLEALSPSVTVGTRVSAIGIPQGSWLLSLPYQCLRDIHSVASCSYRRSAVKFVAEVERFTDPETEGVIVGTGQNPSEDSDS